MCERVEQIAHNEPKGTEIRVDIALQQSKYPVNLRISDKKILTKFSSGQCCRKMRVPR